MTTPADRPPPKRPLPESVRRARHYAAIFIEAGDRWRDLVPDDGQVDGDHVTIDGCLLWPEAGTWRITVAVDPWMVKQEP